MKNDKQFNNNLFISSLTINNAIAIHAEEAIIPPNQPSCMQDKYKVIIGNYRLGKQIGSGGFGKVHLGLHLATNQKVGIKMMNKQKFRTVDIPRIKKQMQILSIIRHRHIIHLYQIIQTRKCLLMVTEYMPKGQLFQHILASKRLPEQEACIYFQQIISAVQYLHQRGIAHRDLKPENILIDQDNQLKLIDFGLSHQYQKDEHLKTFCGSPCYAAPQVLSAKKSYSPLEADIWSCGIILYTMLCGYLPFCDSNTYSLYKKILQCQFKFPNFISVSSKNLLQNILTLNPKKRFTLKQIKEHEWFNTIVPKSIFGLFKDQHISLNKQIIQELITMNFSEQKINQSVSKNLKDKQSAAYYILMKKKINKGQKIQQYIGNDYFNHILIIKPQEKIKTSEEVFNQVIESSEIIKPPQIMEQSQKVVFQGTANPQQSKSKPFHPNDQTRENISVMPLTFNNGITDSKTIKQISPISEEQAENQNSLIGSHLTLQGKDKMQIQRLKFYNNNFHLFKKKFNFKESIFSMSQKIQYQRWHNTIQKNNRYINPEVKTIKYNGNQLLWIHYIYKKQFRRTLKRQNSMSTIKTINNRKSIQIKSFLPTIKNRSFISKESNKNK